MDLRDVSALLCLLFEFDGRPNPAVGDDIFLSAVHDVFRDDAGRGDSESSSRHSSDATRRLSHIVLIVGIHLSGRERSPAAAIALVHRADALLPRSHSRCVPARWWLGRVVAGAARAGIAWRSFLLAGVEGDARDAG